jgi:signal peptidase II
MTQYPDPWSSAGSDSPERAEARAEALRAVILRERRSFGGLFGSVVVLVIAADQLSKAWFVFRLGNHQAAGFQAFLAAYWKLFAPPASKDGLVMAHYWPFKAPLNVFGDWVQWHLTTNTGAAWSMFSGNSLASGVSIAIALLLYYIWRRSFRGIASMSLACGGIIGGALGNFADRFRMHEVVDFIAVKIPLIGRAFPKLGDPYDFPIFNIADACAVCGTLALTFYLIAHDRAHHHAPPAAPPSRRPTRTCPGRSRKRARPMTSRPSARRCWRSGRWAERTAAGGNSRPRGSAWSAGGT